jgi:type I restriction enzyme R subunit
VKKLLAKKGPEIVFATIQKYVDRDLEKLGADDDLGDLGLLNDDEAILVLVDEAHRSHSNALHAALLQALPNCARIGFTGTPIIMGDKKRTHDIFGEFIDRYTIKESEADGATVPILYEGRYAKGASPTAAGLDEELARCSPSMSAEEREALKRKYGTLGAILEAEELIAAKAATCSATTSRTSCPTASRRRSWPSAAGPPCATRRPSSRRGTSWWPRPRLDAATRPLDDLELVGKPKKLRAAVRAPAVSSTASRALEFAAVISPDNNDPPSGRVERRRRSSPHRPLQEALRATRTRQARPARVPDREVDAAHRLRRAHRGRDVPRPPIREAELLQAIARVNRTYTRQEGGHRGRLLRHRQAPEGGSHRLQRRGHRGGAPEPRRRDPQAARPPRAGAGAVQARDIDPHIADVEAASSCSRDERLRAEFA